MNERMQDTMIEVDLFKDKWTGQHIDWDDWLSELCVTPEVSSGKRQHFGQGSGDMQIPLVEIGEASLLGGRLYVTDVYNSDSDSGESTEHVWSEKHKHAQVFHTKNTNTRR